MSEYLGITLGKLKIPLHVFQEDEYSFDDITVEYEVDSRTVRWDEEQKNWLYNPLTDLRIPSDVRERIPHLVEQRRKAAEAGGATFYDGQQVRLVDYRIAVEDKGEMKKFRLVLKFAPTSWVTYQATNFSLDEKILKDEQGYPLSIREKYNIHPLILNDLLANSTGVSTSLISETDGNMIIVERSPTKIVQYPGLYGVAAAGFMNRLRDTVAGVPHPFKTIQRELEEEMGFKDFPYRDFTLFTVGRAGDDLHGELFGEVRTIYTAKEIMEWPKKAKYENLRIIPVPFEPKEVLEYLTQTIDEVPKGITSGLGTWVIGSSPKWVPAHAYATIQSLVKEYGYDRVIKELRKLGYA